MGSNSRFLSSTPALFMFSYGFSTYFISLVTSPFFSAIAAIIYETLLEGLFFAFDFTSNFLAGGESFLGDLTGDLGATATLDFFFSSCCLRISCCTNLI